jgi:hypothetical protein
MRTVVFLVVLPLLVLGCASSGGHWSKTPANAAEQDKDNDSCLEAAKKLDTTTGAPLREDGLPTTRSAQRQYKRCMRTKGYIWNMPAK